VREHIKDFERRVADWTMRDDTAVDRFLDWLYWSPKQRGGGSAGVREPRRPLPFSGAGQMRAETDQ